MEFPLGSFTRFSLAKLVFVICLPAGLTEKGMASSLKKRGDVVVNASDFQPEATAIVSHKALKTNYPYSLLYFNPLFFSFCCFVHLPSQSVMLHCKCFPLISFLPPYRRCNLLLGGKAQLT